MAKAAKRHHTILPSRTHTHTHTHSMEGWSVVCPKRVSCSYDFSLPPHTPSASIATPVLGVGRLSLTTESQRDGPPVPPKKRGWWPYELGWEEVGRGKTHAPFRCTRWPSHTHQHRCACTLYTRGGGGWPAAASERGQLTHTHTQSSRV